MHQNAKQYKDVEAQNYKDWKAQSDIVPIPSSTSALEYTIDTRTKFLYLGCWFVLNLVLTIYNKALLQGVSMGFSADVHDQICSCFVPVQLKFPWLLTTLHTTCVSIGCYTLLLGGHFKLSTLSTHDNLVLAGFSTIFTINIAISNVSL